MSRRVCHAAVARTPRSPSLKALARLSAAAAPLAFGCTPAAAQDYAARVLRRPAAQVVAGNQERLIILPRIELNYETNTVPYSGPGIQSSRGNARITPGVDVSLIRTFGRTRVTLAGTAGYDFNTQYKFLDQPRINTSLAVSQPVLANCSIDGRAFFQQFRYNQFDLTQAIDAKSRTQVYDANVSCDRPVGFSPVFGTTYSKQSSDQLAIFNYTSLSFRAGVAYTLPSLGTLNLTASTQRLRRPEIKKLIGIDDGTAVKQINLGLSRSVSPRLALNAGIGYYDADPKRPFVPSSSGLSYNVSAAYTLRPGFTISGSAARDITNESGISATYVRRDDYQLAGTYRLSSASAVSVSSNLTYRDFTGEDVANTTTPIGRDRVTQVAASYSLDTFKRLRFTAGIRHLWRDSRMRIYDYQSTIVTATIGARF